MYTLVISLWGGVGWVKHEERGPYKRLNVAAAAGVRVLRGDVKRLRVEVRNDAGGRVVWRLEGQPRS